MGKIYTANLTFGGGCCRAQGSHKSRLPLPMPPHLSCDLPQVKHIEMDAGDVIIYLTTHGVRAWRGEHERRFAATNASQPLAPRLWTVAVNVSRKSLTKECFHRFVPTFASIT